LGLRPKPRKLFEKSLTKNFILRPWGFAPHPLPKSVIHYDYLGPVPTTASSQILRRFFANQGGSDAVCVERTQGTADAEWRKIDQKMAAGGRGNRP